MKYKFLIEAHNRENDGLFGHKKEVGLEIVAKNETEAILKAKELIKRNIYKVYRVEPNYK